MATWELVSKLAAKLSYIATVQAWNLLVGRPTLLLEPKPGDEFELKLGRKQIRLVPVGSRKKATKTETEQIVKPA